MSHIFNITWNFKTAVYHYFSMVINHICTSAHFKNCYSETDSEFNPVEAQDRWSEEEQCVVSDPDVT